MHKADEHFSVNGHQLPLTMTDFWAWAYSDMSYNINRTVLAEYIVASALSITSYVPYAVRKFNWPYEMITKDGYIINVKTAAYVQSYDPEHPDFIEFNIAPRRVLDGTAHKSDIPYKRHCDFYVFCVYKGMNMDDSPLNLDLWDFFLMPTKVLEETIPKQRSLTLNSMLRYNPIKCDFSTIADGMNELIQKQKNCLS